MTDNAERWRNVAQAAQWLAEGREVDCRPVAIGCAAWRPMSHEEFLRFGLYPHNEYRLKPEPPKPREWILTVSQYMTSAVLASGGGVKHGERIRVREVIE